MSRKSRRGKKLIEILKTARKQRRTARIFNGFEKDSLWRQTSLSSTRFRSQKTKCIEVDNAEYSPKRKECAENQKRKAKKKDVIVNLARKKENPSCLAVRRTQEIGALQYRLSVAVTVRENEISNIASTFNIGSGRTFPEFQRWNRRMICRIPEPKRSTSGSKIERKLSKIFAVSRFQEISCNS